jgi:hypothetical protein
MLSANSNGLESTNSIDATSHNTADAQFQSAQAAILEMAIPLDREVAKTIRAGVLRTPGILHETPARQRERFLELRRGTRQSSACRSKDA